MYSTDNSNTEFSATHNINIYTMILRLTVKPKIAYTIFIYTYTIKSIHSPLPLLEKRIHERHVRDGILNLLAPPPISKVKECLLSNNRQSHLFIHL